MRSRQCLQEEETSKGGMGQGKEEKAAQKTRGPMLMTSLTAWEDANAPGRLSWTQPKGRCGCDAWNSSWIIIRCALVTTCC